MSHDTDASHEPAVRAAAPTWNGSPLVLSVGQNVNMPKTTNGTMVFAYLNQATQSNEGQLTVTSGGTRPTDLDVPALVNQPSLWIHNWQGNNLSVSNTSEVSPTPIWIMAYGPGLPGQNPLNLPSDGKPVPLAVAQSAKGTALPRNMQLKFTAGTGDLTVLALIGGPLVEGNNGYVFALNWPPDKPPLPGYTATTPNNSYTYRFNWGSSTLFVANMSPATATGATVSLTPL